MGRRHQKASGNDRVQRTQVAMDPSEQLAAVVDIVAKDPGLSPGWKVVVGLLIFITVLLAGVCAHLHKLKENNWREYAAEFGKLYAELREMFRNEISKHRD